MDDLDLLENLQAIENLVEIEIDAEIVVDRNRESLDPFQRNYFLIFWRIKVTYLIINLWKYFIIANLYIIQLLYAQTFYYISDLSDRSFIGMYLLSKELCKGVITIVRPFIKESSRQGALTVERKVNYYNIYSGHFKFQFLSIIL